MEKWYHYRSHTRDFYEHTLKNPNWQWYILNIHVPPFFTGPTTAFSFTPAHAGNPPREECPVAGTDLIDLAFNAAEEF